MECWCPCGCGCATPTFEVDAATGLCPDCGNGNHELGPRDHVERTLPRIEGLVEAWQQALDNPAATIPRSVIRAAGTCPGCETASHAPGSRAHLAVILPLAREWARNLGLRLTVEEALFEIPGRSVFLNFAHAGMTVVEWKDGAFIPFAP